MTAFDIIERISKIEFLILSIEKQTKLVFSLKNISKSLYDDKIKEHNEEISELTKELKKEKLKFVDDILKGEVKNNGK